jgi:alpha-glucosidase
MKNLLLTLAVLITGTVSAQKIFTLTSPDGLLKAEISVGDKISWTLSHDGEAVLDPSTIAMENDGVASFGIESRLVGSMRRTLEESFPAAVYKRSTVRNDFNELRLKFSGSYNVIFRAYDDGVAYRFEYTGKKPFKVLGEVAEFAFADDPHAFVPYVREQKKSGFDSQFFNSFEQRYTYVPLSEWSKGRLAFLPIAIERAGGKKVCITEADLLDYPGMYLYGDGSTTLKGVFAPYPKAEDQGGHNRLQMIVTTREDYIAQVAGPEAFPWRVVVVSTNDAQLADNDMVYKLATPPTGDFSWVKPGKVAWDWWNDWNLYGVDFETGVNNDTYKYYIDFAAKEGIGYVILDEGWAVNLQADLMQVVPEIDLPMLAEYADLRGVGLILWAGYWAFDRDMEEVCRHYSAMGVKGFKVDFMDRDDQKMVDFHRRGAEMCAKYGLMVDYHGTYKPTGLHRTYPNVINFEGVNGLEQMKWDSTGDQVTYDVTIPFIRQLAGPMDYTQGAMRNATRSNYRAVNSEPMSQGTRCRQLAEYVVFESPLQMLCDSPSNYIEEPECTDYIAAIPTVWDETRALAGEVSKYIAMARRSGDVWYVGAMTDWDARTMTLDLGFLGEGTYKAEIYSDGVNADRVARDYRREVVELNTREQKKFGISMAPGGGWAAVIRPMDAK